MKCGSFAHLTQLHQVCTDAFNTYDHSYSSEESLSQPSPKTMLPSRHLTHASRSVPACDLLMTGTLPVWDTTASPAPNTVPSLQRGSTQCFANKWCLAEGHRGQIHGVYPDLSSNLHTLGNHFEGLSALACKTELSQGAASHTGPCPRDETPYGKVQGNPVTYKLELIAGQSQ